MAGLKIVDRYVREHAVKVCREECIDMGLHGEALDKCIEECLRKVRESVYADR